ncbi:MAG: hypothetical protein EA378_11280 [Phycisphaerales bacterium]|nr:MAG: hypothetical protein EA378_11280 [Phycisphaerales bacterium]
MSFLQYLLFRSRGGRGPHAEATQPVAPSVVVVPRRPSSRRARPQPTVAARPKTNGRASPMQARYDAMTREYLSRYRVRVRKWRTSMSGVAWQVRYADGSVSRLIEAPYPRGPMSAAVFLHEIGHHAIGFTTYRLRCLEEYHAWAYALREMERLGLNITEAVRRRMHDSLHYAVAKGERRGLRRVPPELEPYTKPWAGARPTRRRAG